VSTPAWARTALSHPVFTGLSRQRLGELTVELYRVDRATVTRTPIAHQLVIPSQCPADVRVLPGDQRPGRASPIGRQERMAIADQIKGDEPLNGVSANLVRRRSPR
jgi:hypothetical protein